MKSPLLWKLVGINVSVIATVLLVVWWAFDYLAADYFMILMDEYQIASYATNAMFLGAVHRYLIWGGLLALVLGLVLCVLLTRRVLKPLSRITRVTQQLARGDYSARVDLRGDDEIARLGQAFDRMADALARIEQLRERMVADAAHELRTPLSNIQGYLEAMCDGVMIPSHERLTMLQTEVLRLARLAESLLDLARADAAPHDLKLEPVSLRALIDEALTLGQPQLVARRLQIERRLSPQADRVWADKAKLRQVLRNLIENAGHYAAPGGRLCVELTREADSVRLSLTNDGQTFTAAEADVIFERFYRADPARARGQGAAGIGLAIVKELVEAHGGKVGAEVGDGQTSIWLRLPLAAGAQSHPLVPGTPLTAQPAMGRS